MNTLAVKFDDHPIDVSFTQTSLHYKNNHHYFECGETSVKCKFLTKTSNKKKFSFLYFLNCDCIELLRIPFLLLFPGSWGR